MAAILLAAGGCASADSSAPSTIYLDPETGQVIQHPGHKHSTSRSDQTMANSDNASSSADSNTAQQGHVVHCADGSLRMGSGGHGDEQGDDARALCSGSVK